MITSESNSNSYILVTVNYLKYKCFYDKHIFPSSTLFCFQLNLSIWFKDIKTKEIFYRVIKQHCFLLWLRRVSLTNGKNCIREEDRDTGKGNLILTTGRVEDYLNNAPVEDKQIITQRHRHTKCSNIQVLKKKMEWSFWLVSF